MAQPLHFASMAAVSDAGIDVQSLLEAAENCRRAGQLTTARDTFMSAAKVAEAAGDDLSFVTAALGAGGLWVHEHRDVVARAAVYAIWQHVGSLVPVGSLEDARLQVRHAAEGVYEGAPVEAVMAAVEAVRPFGDEAALAEAFSLLHNVQLGPRHAETRLGLAEESLRLGARSGDALLTLMGLCWRTVDLFLLGDPRAGQSLEELRERSDEGACEAICFVADVLGAMVQARAGRFEKAEAAATSALDRGTAAGDPDAPAVFRGHARGPSMVARARGRSGRAGPDDLDLSPSGCQ